MNDSSSDRKVSIFVFGSNLAGRHGKGAALHARKFYGAEYGIGCGRTGNAYAIPCGLAGYSDSQIAPMFRGVSDNVQIPDEWREYLS